MAAPAQAANVIAIDTHPAWRRARPSAEVLAAMRRHPSYRGRALQAVPSGEDAAVIRLRRR